MTDRSEVNRPWRFCCRRARPASGTPSREVGSYAVSLLAHVVAPSQVNRSTVGLGAWTVAFGVAGGSRCRSRVKVTISPLSSRMPTPPPSVCAAARVCPMFTPTTPEAPSAAAWAVDPLHDRLARAVDRLGELAQLEVLGAHRQRCRRRASPPNDVAGEEHRAPRHDPERLEPAPHEHRVLGDRQLRQHGVLGACALAAHRGADDDVLERQRARVQLALARARLHAHDRVGADVARLLRRGAPALCPRTSFSASESVSSSNRTAPP